MSLRSRASALLTLIPRSRAAWTLGAVAVWSAVAAAEDPAKPVRPKELANPHLVNHWAQAPRSSELWSTAEREAARGGDGLRASVETWIELAAKFGQWLMPQPADPDLVEHYTSIHAAARAKLRGLTVSQREQLADLLEAPASRELILAQRRRSAEELEGVAARFPWSETAITALIAAGDMRLETGDAGGAAWSYRQALALRGDRASAGDARLVLRCARALAAAHRATELRALADRLAFTSPALTLPGTTGPAPASDVLRALAAHTRNAAEVWPEPDPSGGPGAEPPPLGTVRRDWTDDPESFGDRYIAFDQPGSAPPEASPFLPVAGDGVVVLNHGTALHGYDLHTLKLVWPGPRGLSERDGLNRSYARAPWSSGAAICGHAVVGTVEYPSRLRRLSGRSNHIVVLDLRTGVPVAPELSSREVERALVAEMGESDQLRFSGTPVWRGGRLYTAVLRRRREAEEVWVAALAPSTTVTTTAAGTTPGWRVMGHCYITTRAQNFQDPRGLDELSARLSDGGDRLFLSTSTGSMAAIDPLTCRVSWLAKYRLAGDTFDGQSSFLPGRVELAADAVAFGPHDSDTLYLLDRATGRLLWARTGTAVDPDQYARYLEPERTSGPWRSVLGIRHGRVFVQRDRSIEILPLNAERIEGRRVMWDDQALQIQRADPDSTEPPAVMGRPAFGAAGCAVAGGSTLVLLPVRRTVTPGDDTEVITMTGAPIDEVNLDALPVPELAAPGARRRGPLLAGACLRINSWGVPRKCAHQVPSAPDDEAPRTCNAWLPVPHRAGPVVCPSCAHVYPARPVRQLVMVSRDFLTVFELDPAK